MHSISYVSARPVPSARFSSLRGSLLTDTLRASLPSVIQLQRQKRLEERERRLAAEEAQRVMVRPSDSAVF